MVKKHYPELIENVSTTISPMCAVSRMLKAKEPDAVTVFIGPCISKKSEVKDHAIEGNADYALTYSEIRAIMHARNVELEEDDNSYQESSIYGKRFANSGGVTEAVLQSLKESDDEIAATVNKCNGAAECKKALLLMKVGRLPEDFIEGMICEGEADRVLSVHRLLSKRTVRRFFPKRMSVVSMKIWIITIWMHFPCMQRDKRKRIHKDNRSIKTPVVFRLASRQEHRDLLRKSLLSGVSFFLRPS